MVLRLEYLASGSGEGEQTLARSSPRSHADAREEEAERSEEERRGLRWRRREE